MDDCPGSTELDFIKTFQQVGKCTTMGSRVWGGEDSLTMLLQVDLKVTSFVFSLKNYRLKKYKNVLL